MPTTMQAYVKKKKAVVVYKVVHGIKFNLGKLLFDQIVTARNGRKGRKKLILPNLIISLLLVHGFKPTKNEFLEAHKEII